VGQYSLHSTHYPCDGRQHGCTIFWLALDVVYKLTVWSAHFSDAPTAYDDTHRRLGQYATQPSKRRSSGAIACTRRRSDVTRCSGLDRHSFTYSILCNYMTSSIKTSTQTRSSQYFAPVISGQINNLTVILNANDMIYYAYTSVQSVIYFCLMTNYELLR